MQLYSQGIAFGQLQKESKNIHDPVIFQSYDYFSHYITSLRSLWLNVTSASGQKVEAKSFSGSIKLSDILLNVLSKYVSASQLSDITKLFDFIAITSDTQIVALLDFWWDNISHAENQTALAFGLLDIDNQKQPSYAVIYCSLNYSVSQWQSLFVEVQNTNLDVYTSAITMNYSMDLYNSTIAPAIMPVIRGAIESHVRSYK
jgi:hypothetical protein